jgi:3-deoxy-D-manno-octulosonate 8-phosphate phosphatase (KDO 8-P phosphatase)
VKRIKAVAMDVDGVLTDGYFFWGPNGEEFKRFSFRDVMGISLARKSGLLFALISGEASPLVDRFAQKMGIVDVYKGCKDKATALKEFAAAHHLELAEICFIGDDVNDLPAFSIAGWAVAPGNAHPKARQAANYVAKADGGCGAVREFLDLFMDNPSGAE